MRRVHFALVAAFALAGCSEVVASNAQDVSLAIDKNVYVAGESISAQLINGSDEQIGIGACDLRLEHLSAGGWATVGPESVLCIGIMYIIEPGGVRQATLPLEGTLSAGLYRLRQTVYPKTQLPTQFVRSTQFRIQASSASSR